MKNADFQPADFEYWLKVRDWSAWEAACLLAGFEPDSVSTNPPDQQRDTYQEINRVFRIFRSAAKSGEFGTVRYGSEGESLFPPISGHDWISWACQNGVTILYELQNVADSNNSGNSSDQDNVHPRKEATYQRIIGALLHLLTDNTNGKPNSIFRNQEAIVQEVIRLYGERDGISERNLDAKFAEAKRRLETDY